MEKRIYAVTGAASGIGKATADLLDSGGDRVIRVDRVNAEVIGDLGDPAGRLTIIAQVEAACGGILDGLVACAATSAPEPNTLSVNYFGTIAVIEGLRPCLARSTAPRVVVVGSTGAIFSVADPISKPLSPDPQLEAACIKGMEQSALSAAASTEASRIYHTSKRVVMRWARQQAITESWAGAGILMNVVSPGATDTGMSNMNRSEEGDRVLKYLLPRPLGRRGMPLDIAGPIAYLVSAANSFILGQVLFVDGGSEATLRGSEYW